MILSGPIITQWADDGVHMTVLASVSFRDKAGRVWEVPQGFVTDGASIPKEFWSLIGAPFNGLYRNAAIFHDAAYANPKIGKGEADAMLLECMLGMGCLPDLAQIIYLGVKLGGASSYAADQLQARRSHA